MDYHHTFNKDYIHHQKSSIITALREIVFGMEDGMVSTLGAITGIAIGSRDPQVVLLAGCVIISVESISMGIGSYLSNLSHKEVEQRKIAEEMEELKNYPEEEKEELKMIYKEDGWPEELAREMAEVAAQNPDLILKEMIKHELDIPTEESNPGLGGMFMFGAYIIGGFVPLTAYIFLPIEKALFISTPITLLGLFALGAATTRFTKQNWLKSSLRMFVLGGIALGVGLIAGTLFK
jgi:VIT1/CCC1 family predicted Fe2+/Mn2+ transporter